MHLVSTILLSTLASAVLCYATPVKAQQNPLSLHQQTGLTGLPKVQLTSTSNSSQSQLPFSYAQVFAPGDLSSNTAVEALLDDGRVLPLQMDVKRLHADGSVRHAVFSAVLPTLAGAETRSLQLRRTVAGGQGQGAKPLDLLNAGFSGSVTLTVAGLNYSVALEQLLRTASAKTWLQGPYVSEWLYSAPLRDANGVAHPHLHARFAIRSYTGYGKAKLDVVIENDWAYQVAPQNYNYDVQITLAGQNVYSQNNLNHFHHTRWKKTFWWGGEPQLHLAHDIDYLIASKAVPNYDRSVKISETALNAYANSMQSSAAKFQIMGPGLAEPYMPATGGRPDIGLLPGWSAAYLLSMDKRVKIPMLATADLAGSWSMHYRDQNTDKPISLQQYPYMTILGTPGDTYNPLTKKREAFPVCGGTCSNTNAADFAHTPAFSYLPYLLTGDYYHLEEMQFWALWDVFQTNPGYRNNIQGLIVNSNVRVQAWTLRNLAEAAYITPDDDNLKTEFERLLNNNLDYYNTTYSNNPGANSFGAITGPGAIVYNTNRGVAPWMDDFFTSAIGRARELGFSKAAPLLNWKAKFSANRMLAPGYCWILGAIYSLNLRDSATAPFYASFAQAYEASRPANLAGLTCNSPEMAKALGLKLGEMTGYSSVYLGFPSNMQPALAYAVDSDYADSIPAWQRFMQRSVKPDYSMYPEFAIVPRRQLSTGLK